MINIDFISPNKARGLVESVNGKVGKVELTAEDLGAATKEYVEEKLANAKDKETEAEVIDIRLGADGVTHDSAGEAVRSQIIDVNKKIDLIASFEKKEVSLEPINVIEGIEWGKSGTFWSDRGEISSNEYTVRYTALSELIVAVPGAKYYTEKFLGQVKILDSNKVKIDSFSVDAVAIQLSITAPDNAAYIAINAFNNIEGVVVENMKMYRTLTEAEIEKLPYKVVYNFEDNSIGLKKIENEALNIISPLLNKTIVNFGDSIYGNANAPTDISSYLADLTGAKVYNCGFGGCRMSKHESEYFAPFSMYKIADAVTSGDFTEQEQALENAISTGQTGMLVTKFPSTLEQLKRIDFNKVDIITIAYGTNDYLSSRTIDSDENRYDTNIFGGALRYSIEKLLEAYPHLQIYIVSLTYLFFMDSTYNFVEDSNSRLNNAGKLLTDYNSKSKEIAKEYTLPYIDNYSVGINKFNRSIYFPTTDGVHQNATGRNLIARNIANKLY